MALKGKTVLITGASSGIGAATAVRLAKAGWTVFATARNPASLSDATAAGCKPLALDVTEEASMRDAVDRIARDAGGIDVLINNAGYSQSGALEMLDIGGVRRQFETNVFGLLRLTQLVLPGMRAKGGGRIVNLSSMGGKLTFPGGGAYHASKYAVEALSDALRFEVAGFGIDVVVIEPGLIRTNFAAAAKNSIDASARTDVYAAFDAAVARATEEAYDKGPLARLGGRPEDVARVIETAITANKPRPRYKVTASAHLLMALRRLLSDRMWDKFVGGSFPQPGKTA